VEELPSAAVKHFDCLIVSSSEKKVVFASEATDFILVDFIAFVDNFSIFKIEYTKIPMRERIDYLE
jgi:hypothetical protein